MLGENLFKFALIRSHILQDVHTPFFIYTDSDISLKPSYPADFAFRFASLWDAKRDEGYRKVGPALKGKDLPKSYAQRNSAMELADSMVSKPLQPDKRFPDLELYEGTLDSTLALYHTASVKESNEKQTFLNYGQIPETDPYAHLGQHIVKTLIVGGIYAVTHTDWHFDSECPSEDVNYYIAHKERVTSFNNR